ncbi:MAG: DUF4198 domain-containing protein [Gemmatimonadales bacterium]
MKRSLVVAIGCLLLASWAAAHDFWLVPVGEEIRGINGSNFPVSANAVAPSRLAEAVAVSGAGRKRLEVIGTRDSMLILKADPGIGGIFYAAVALHPRRINLSGTDFNEYLLHDGLPQIHALRQQGGQLDSSAVERYQKFAKALIARPGAGSVALEPVGQRLELVPLADPAALRPGDTLRVEVRFENRPIGGLTIHAGFEGQPGGGHAQTHRSDARGRVAVPIGRTGLWYVRTIHMREVNEPPFQWESFWASLTFTVR